jgi:adenylate kinase
MEGKSIDDDVTINLLLKRIAYKDCVLNGWILEDFPKTRNQAVMMTRKGIVPTNVFYLVKS